jgi:hypothetical protein
MRIVWNGHPGRKQIITANLASCIVPLSWHVALYLATKPAELQFNFAPDGETVVERMSESRAEALSEVCTRALSVESLLRDKNYATPAERLRAGIESRKPYSEDKVADIKRAVNKLFFDFDFQPEVSDELRELVEAIERFEDTR